MPEPTDSPKTFEWILTATTRYFAAHGVDAPRATAEHLVARLLRCKRSELVPWLQKTVPDSWLEARRRGMQRIASGEPLQYVIGQWDFRDFTLKTDARALIPRPETAELVRWVADDARRDGAVSLLDVGTGSGCIALSLASLLPGVGVEGWDVSEGALRVARDNGRRLGLAVRFLRQDILAPVLPDVRFDVVVSNPPYVTEAERAGMERNVLCWEPASALFVPDDDPLRFYRAIARFATRALPPGGKLYFEINQAYGSATVRLLEDMGYARVELRRDLSGNDRMIKAIL